MRSNIKKTIQYHRLAQLSNTTVALDSEDFLRLYLDCRARHSHRVESCLLSHFIVSIRGGDAMQLKTTSEGEIRRDAVETARNETRRDRRCITMYVTRLGSVRRARTRKLEQARTARWPVVRGAP